MNAFNLKNMSSWCDLPKDIKAHIFKMLIRDNITANDYGSGLYFMCRIKSKTIVKKPTLRIVQLMNRLCFNKECKRILKSFCEFGTVSCVAVWLFVVDVFKHGL